MDSCLRRDDCCGIVEFIDPRMGAVLFFLMDGERGQVG